MPVWDPIKEVPGYAEAIAEEYAGWNRAFVDVPETICGIDVLPFTPGRFVILEVAKSPFVCGGIPKPEDVAIFLWVVSDKFRPVAKWGDRLARWLFIRRCRNLNLVEACLAINRYLEEAFADSPGTSGKSGLAYRSYTAALLHAIASSYGWSEGVILATPFKRLFQYLKDIRQDRDPEASVFRRSDRVKLKWLKDQQDQARKN